MIQSLFDEYIYTIGKLKDVYKFEVDTSHREIHTFYLDKIPIFKLLLGKYQGTEETNIVISFHIDIDAVTAVDWFMRVSDIHPLLKIADSYIEDDRGETYLGEDAKTIKNLKLQQEVLEAWLEQKDKQDVKDFVDGNIVGRVRESTKLYSSQVERDKAKIEFSTMKKPDDDGEVQ